MAPKNTYAAYRLDKSETEGSWQDLRSGGKVKVRYENSTRVQDDARRLDKKYRAIMMTEGGLPAETQAERDTELCATSILVDWADITDENGALIPFSIENARRVLTDLPEMRRDVVYAARVSENFRAQEQAQIAGNLPLPSGKPLG